MRYFQNSPNIFRHVTQNSRIRVIAEAAGNEVAASVLSGSSDSGGARMDGSGCGGKSLKRIGI